MAGLVAWLFTVVLMMAWIAMSSPIWFTCAIFGWKKQAQAVAVGPMRTIQRSLERACGEIHRALWEQLGWWTLAVYGGVLVILAIIGASR